MTREAIKTLQAEIRADLESVERIFRELDGIRQEIPSNRPPSLRDKAVIGYLLHNLYCAFENIFKNIAALFGNATADPESWHAYLLKRMTLTIESVRPSVIGSESYEALDELRRFRHFFRHAYTMDLDWERMSLVLRKVDLLLRNRYRQELAEFIAFLDDLSASLP